MNCFTILAMLSDDYPTEPSTAFRCQCTHCPTPMPALTNKGIAEELIKKRRAAYVVPDLRRATAIRVAGHRLGKVLTVRREKRGWKLVLSSTRVSHRRRQASRKA